jgi:type III restriction enzyme
MAADALERLKLEDGVRLHDQVKVELETYARETGNKHVKPFVLVIARDTTHAKQLLDLIQSDGFFDGRYKAKVIQVDSSKSGAEEDEMVERLLKVESSDEPTEIVIHVNMLKEGWDVTNLYTIVPLRAANARVLIEQSIGRGLRLPYGKRTGVTVIDRLNIVAHDKFQEIIDEANRPESPIRLQRVILDPTQIGQKTVTVISPPQIESLIGRTCVERVTDTIMPSQVAAPAFTDMAERNVAVLTYEVIRELSRQPGTLASSAGLESPEIQSRIVEEVASRYRPQQVEMTGVVEGPDIPNIVAQAIAMHAQKTIDIPRVLVVPKGEVESGFTPFTLKTDSLNYPPVSEELWIRHLRSKQIDVLSTSQTSESESRLEEPIVRELMEFEDISYDSHADLLYQLAGQVVQHLRSYLASDEEVRKVLSAHQREIAKYVHVQMQEHYWEKTAGYEVKVSSGFSELKRSAFTASAVDTVRDFSVSPEDKSNMAKYLFGGFSRCLYPVQKFHSEAERRMAVILERDAVKWFKPAKGQFQILYKLGASRLEYQPDFVAETADAIYMLEPKSTAELTSDDVIAKRDAAVQWCIHATEFTTSNGGKPWRYVLIPHDQIAENSTLQGLAARFGKK